MANRRAHADEAMPYGVARATTGSPPAAVASLYRVTSGAATSYTAKTLIGMGAAVGWLMQEPNVQNTGSSFAWDATNAPNNNVILQPGDMMYAEVTSGTLGLAAHMLLQP